MHKVVVLRTGLLSVTKSEASTSTMNCLFGSAWIRIGAVAKRCLSFLKAVSASGEHVKGHFVEVSRVRGKTNV